MEIGTIVASGLNLRLARAGARQIRRGSFLSALLMVGAVLFGPGGGRCQAQVFPPQGDDTTPSMGVFRITVDPAFRPLVDQVGALVPYTGYNPANGRLTSPLCIDNATTIGRSGPNSRFYTFPVPVGAGSWDNIAGYASYPLIPALWAGAPTPTEEVLTEIKSFALLSAGGTAGQHCPPDPRIPDVPLNWTMVKAGTFAGVSPRSIGMVQENVPNGPPGPNFPARSFFDIFVEVNLPPIPGTESSVAFPVAGALFYNDSPLVITNLNLTSFPPSVIYIHGETPAVPLKFKVSNPPYWNAGDIFGYLVLAGHGTTSSDCNDTTAVNTLLDAVLGPIGTSKPELPVEWPRTTTLCPSPGSTYDSVKGTNSDGTSIDVVKFTLPTGGAIQARNFSHGNFPNAITPPALNSTATYSAPNTLVILDVSPDGQNWGPAQATGPVGVTIHHTSDAGGTSFFDTEMFQLNLQGVSPFGPFMIRESPSKQSLGKHTIRPDGNLFRISSFFDVFLELSLDGGQTWVPADRAIRVQPGPPPPPAIVLNCSSNITVTATSAKGAVVTYTSSATGGCPPVTVTCNPPSGSTFPIGTNTVTCTAIDACGQVVDCSFTVTVNPLPTPQAPEYFFAQPVLPPIGSVYISPAQWHVLFAQGIVIRDVRHRFFTQNYPLPPLGTSQTETFSSELDFDLSTDNGVTFQPASGTANVTVQVTHTQDVGSTMFFDTEMLQLDLTSGNLRLRESPTLQSTGQTTVRPVAGGYMVSSFFDVFTEVSTDGGASWQPAQQPGHVEMHPDPKQVTPATEPTPLLPPPNGAYVSPQQWHALYAQGIVIKDVSHRLFTGALQPPAAGATNVHNFDSQIDLQVSTDGGITYQSVRVAAPVQVSVASHGSSADTIYDTEMTMLNLSLPNGVMIRESPTEPSRGEVEVDAQSDGTYRISSFFDIFTELSLDGGATWAPATNGPVRVELVPIASEVPKPTPNLPPLDGSYVSPAQWHALYANGIIITNASHDRFTQTQPPPPPGGSQAESFGSRVTGLISMNGGASFQPFSAPADVAVQVSSRADLDTGNTRFFDTEMLSLNLSGGTLPGGIMVRESPSKQSLGRTSVRTTPSDYRVSSFFDIFTEVSLDGGQTWSPSTTAPGTMGLNTNAPVPPIVLTCSSNLTVATTSATGAVVTYSSSASGGCSPPPTVVCNPPSGSTFPIGSTTVTCTASNACGQTADCSFTVTVVKLNLTIQPVGSQMRVIWSTGTLQQADKVEGPYIDVDPQPASPWTFTPDSARKFFRVRAGQPGFTFYDTEMLQLDISGGNLPAGMRLRESPTLASTGKTAISPAPGGGFLIDSFFDVFTEVSMDGGQTWQASTGAPPRMRFTGSAPTNDLPPKDANYVSPADWHAAYAQGIYLTNASHLSFIGSYPPPPAGGTTNTHTFGSTVNMLVRQCPTCPFVPVTANAQVTVQIRSRP